MVPSQIDLAPSSVPNPLSIAPDDSIREAPAEESSAMIEREGSIASESNPTADALTLDDTDRAAVDSEVDVHAGEPSTTTVILGQSASGSTPVHWEPSVKGSPHMFILGIP